MVDEYYDKTPALKLGELLMKEGFVRKTDIEAALGIQREEAREAKMPIDAYMVHKGMLSEQQLKNLQEHPDYEQMPLYELAFKLHIISKNQVNEVISRGQAQRSLGEILCETGSITHQDLNYILAKYSKHLKFGEILLRNDLIDEDRLNMALQEQTRKADPLGKILLEKKIITVDQLYMALSKQYNIPFRKLEDYVIYDSQVDKLTEIVGYRYAMRNQVVPLSLKGDLLTIAVYDHTRIPLIHELHHVYTHLKIDCVFVTEIKFNEIFENLYGKDAERPPLAVGRKAGAAGLIDLDLEDEPADGRDEKVAGLYGRTALVAEEVVNFIIKYGILHHASDIHIEQNRKKPRIRYRIDGVLQTPKLTWLNDRLSDMIGAIVSRIKVISNLDIAERRLPQDGVFRVNYFDREKKQSFDLDFRVATCPAIIGENVTMRILDSRKADVGLEHLNHSDHVLQPFKQMLRSSAGMVLVSGPTGSGKTSTLYGALKHVYHPGIKIITAEDPIEYSFSDIMQTQVNPKIGLTFARLLRSFLRFDPDVILVGEMRDAETASIGFDAALTGHLLMSTIHTNDSVSVITRLADLSIEPGQIASCLMGALAQRLLRRSCQNCRRRHEPPQDEWSILFKKPPSHLTFYQSDGCSECNFTGYKGRTLISELFVVDRDVSLALNKGADEQQIRKIAIKNGMKTMLDDGIMKLEQTTLSEIIRVVPHEVLKEFRERE